MPTVSSVFDVQPQKIIYDLNELFDAAVADQKMRTADYEQYSSSEYGHSMCQALLNRATTVVDALQAFKDAGATHVQTQYVLPAHDSLNSNPNAPLGTQFDRGQVTPLMTKTL